MVGEDVQVGVKVQREGIDLLRFADYIAIMTESKRYKIWYSGKRL